MHAYILCQFSVCQQHFNYSSEGFFFFLVMQGFSGQFACTSGYSLRFSLIVFFHAYTSIFSFFLSFFCLSFFSCFLINFSCCFLICFLQFVFFPSLLSFVYLKIVLVLNGRKGILGMATGLLSMHYVKLSAEKSNQMQIVSKCNKYG